MEDNWKQNTGGKLVEKAKILALLLAGVMATTVLGGCGSKGSENSSSSQSSSEEKVLNF